MPDRPDSVPTPGEVVCMMQHMNNTTSTSVADIRNHTRRDPILSDVLCYMNSSWPNEPWSRIHIDYAGPIHNQMMLIVVDSHSKWIDVHVTTSSSASVTIEKLMSSFAIHGLPHTSVSDNGPCFVSSEFELFKMMNVIRPIKVSLHHPASNGLAERTVHTVKSGISKMEGGNLQSKVTRFLARYRITPQTTTGISPSQLLMKRRIRSRQDLLSPILSKKVLDAQTNRRCITITMHVIVHLTLVIQYCVRTMEEVMSFCQVISL